MKKKSFLIAIVIILVVSLVPLSGVSAQRTAPASSASMSAVSAPAARATYTKSIKTKLVFNCYGSKCLKYVQKITWQYDNTSVLTAVPSVKGVVFQSPWVYDGDSLVSKVDARPFYFFEWTKGGFHKPTGGKYVALNIMQQVFPDGTWFAYKFYYTGFIA
jgi:hypothetical protein